MKSLLKQSVLAVSLAFAFGALAQQNVLTAVKVDKAPAVESLAADPAWAGAKPVSINLRDGANFPGGKTTATFKAVYTADSLYILLSYDDATQSFRRSPFVKQPDGSWKKLADPDDKGGDNNKYYEDKWAFIWSIDNSIKGFDKQGCYATCHDDEKMKPYGNKYTESAGELGDIWHMKSVRGGVSLGQPDNQYVDHTRYDKEKAPEAGRKSDAKTGGGYEDVKLVNGKPEFMNKDGKAANKGGTYWLKAEDKAPFDDAKFAPGDEVASILVSKFTGERGNLFGAGKWEGGKWTYVVGRKLTTGSPYDVQFKDLGATYLFGFAAFDNAQVRHAIHKGPVVLKFAR
jgi:hypothetical protein